MVGGAGVGALADWSDSESFVCPMGLDVGLKETGKVSVLASLQEKEDW